MSSTSLAGEPTSVQRDPIPKPFIATYAVSFRGLNAGSLEMQWRKDPTSGLYEFQTRANPSTLARLVVSSDAVERSRLELTPSGELRPVYWMLDDGKSGRKGDGEVSFDWPAMKASGTYEGEAVSFTLKPGMQDRLSMQLGVMVSLLSGDEPGTVSMINGDDIREYSYTRGKTERLSTEMGELETIIYESTRPGSSRVSRVWHAPELGYLPAKAEQVRKGKVETVMTLISLERDADPAPQVAASPAD